MVPTANEFYENALREADDEGRVSLSRMTGWAIFPFEREGLRVVSLLPPELPEAPRHGEAGLACGSCDGQLEGTVWQDEHWRLIAFNEPSGAPFVLMLLPKAHFDLIDLPDERAGEFGRLVVHVARAIESLPHIARAHVSRWGDGGAHLHVFFFARPAGFSQLRGTCFALWDDLLAPVARDQRDADVREVVAALVASLELEHGRGVV